MSEDVTATRTRIADRMQDITVWRALLYVSLIGLAVLYLLPLLVTVFTSVKTGAAVARSPSFLPPGLEGITAGNWARAFGLLREGLINSIILVVPVAVISAIMGSMAAYALTHTDWRGQVTILLFVIAAVFLPTQAAIVPLSKFWSIYFPLEEMLMPLWQLPLLQDYHGDLIALIITDIAFGLPICTVLFRSYYKGLSTEMIEAAKTDGASMLAIYRRVIFPLSGPMFAVTIIYQFTQTWNSFLFPLIIMVSSNHPAAPVTLSLAGIGASLEGTDYGLRMAGALLTALPTLIVFILFGDRFAEGVVGRT